MGYGGERISHLQGLYILICIMKDEKSSINEIYEKLDKEILKKNPHLDDYSARYFIAIVRDDIGVS